MATSVRGILAALRNPELEAGRERRERSALIAAMLLAVAVFCIDALTPLGVASGVLYALVVLLTLRLPSASPFLLVAITATLTIAGLLKEQAVAPLWVVATNRGLSIVIQIAAAIAVILHRAHQRQQRTLLEGVEQALLQVRRLEGLLPICAWCKRIRDEAGDWQQFERYVSDRSDADFTHGACPECAERMIREARGRGGA